MDRHEFIYKHRHTSDLSTPGPAVPVIQRGVHVGMCGFSHRGDLPIHASSELDSQTDLFVFVVSGLEQLGAGEQRVPAVLLRTVPLQSGVGRQRHLGHRYTLTWPVQYTHTPVTTLYRSSPESAGSGTLVTGTLSPDRYSTHTGHNTVPLQSGVGRQRYLGHRYTLT